jgi:DNA-binding Lrp family transcriptional regulator
VLDEIDKTIISYLLKNSRASSLEIRKQINNFGFPITDRAVRQRISRLVKKKIVLGYSAILNPELTTNNKINRTILLKFKYSKNSEDLIKLLKEYVQESSFCIYASKLNGDFDWICHFIFDSIEQYEIESINFLNRFGELISDFRTYESINLKLSTYSVYDDNLEDLERKTKVFQILNSLKKYGNLNERLQKTVEYVVKYFNAYFARIWFVDKNKSNLILKFSAGRYTRIDGEFSTVSLSDSLQLGPAIRRKKPFVTNDLPHDPLTRHPEWVKKEKLLSFAAYPLVYKQDAVAVLAIFSKKKFSTIDFEILGVFCDQLSKDLTGFFDAKEFLSN